MSTKDEVGVYAVRLESTALGLHRYESNLQENPVNDYITVAEALEMAQMIEALRQTAELLDEIAGRLRQRVIDGPPTGRGIEKPYGVG